MANFSIRPIFIHEFITGGGWADRELSPGLRAEARAMLQTVLDDFVCWGRFPVVTMQDARLGRAGLSADRVELVSPDKYFDLYTALLAESQAALIIAPETDGILYGLTARAEQRGVQVLGSASEAVAQAGDKLICYNLIRQAGLPTPPTRRVRFADAVAPLEGLYYPLIVKPVDGVGCEGVTLVTSPAEWPAACARLRTVTARPDLVAMEYLSGVHASVSLVASQHGSQPLSLNGQQIVIDNGYINYQGGCIPLAHHLSERAFAVAAQAVALIPGLRGYVGVDLVLTDKEAYLIEINPRLTTSYIGLRQVIDLNLAQAIWEACSCDQLPSSISIHAKVTFNKDGWVTRDERKTTWDADKRG